MGHKGRNSYLTAFGETKTVSEWTRDPRCQVDKITTLSSRCESGMSDQEAIETPLGAKAKKPRLLTYDGETKSVMEWLRDDRCVPKMRTTIMSRLAKGWSHEKVLTWPVKEVKSTRSRVRAWGETKSVPEWVNDERCKVDSATLWRRLKRSDVSPEHAMTVPPGRMTEVIVAWGEAKTATQWEEDDRCRVSAHTLRDRVSRQRMSPEDAIRTPSLRDTEMTLDQRFEAELRTVAALGKAERYEVIRLELLRAAESGVKGEVQFNNRYLVDRRFCLGMWAEPTTIFDFLAEAVHLTEADERFYRDQVPLRRLLVSFKRQSQGTGDLYLFERWFAVEEGGEVWRG